MENKNPELEDMLTELDPPYETKDEMKIGRVLDQYGIPFFYKQATIIYNEGKNEIWKPSFSIYPFGGLVIDYVHDSEQAVENELIRREQVYRYNQIPAVVLGPKSLAEPNWDNKLYDKIKQTYQQTFDYSQYLQVPIDK